jgi:hypothetical protein
MGGMMTDAEWPELGSDLLDPPESEARPGWRWLQLRRPALGVRATSVPTFVFVLLGAALGPAGLNLLTRSALGQTQAIVWVALAVVGVFIGLGLTGTGSTASIRTWVSGVGIAVITASLVAIGLWALLVRSPVPVAGNVWAGSAILGLCASVSAAMQSRTSPARHTARAVQIADLDDMPLLVFGVTIIAALTGTALVLRLTGTIVAGAAIGLAGCLLFERADESERGVFMAGAILLLAGIGAYLGTSPLLSGCIAAIVWTRMPGAADQITARDLRTLQHPLVALLLVIAGATMEWNATTLWVTAYIVVLRLGSKLLASILMAPVARVSPGLLATVLLPPGVMGIALGLNAGQLLSTDYRWIVSAATAATVVSELIATCLPGVAEESA